MTLIKKSRLLLIIAVFALLAAACGDDDDSSSEETGAEETTTAEETTGGEAPADGPTITIGAQDFPESTILAELYGQALEDAGFSVEQQALGGFRDIVFTALDSGDINFTAEYLSSSLEFLNGNAGEASSDVEATAKLYADALAEIGLTSFAAAPAQDSNSFVVTQESADELGLSKVSDLTEDLSLGGPADCEENAFCIPGLVDVYGIDLSAGFVPLDGGGPLTVAALDEGEIDVAVLFSTNGTIADKGWVVLEDDKGLINAENIVPITDDEVAEAGGAGMIAVVDGVSAVLTTEELTEMNRQFTVDKLDAADVATTWLTDQGLIG
jgi:osmoprotectant transport system substrate-binding protein